MDNKITYIDWEDNEGNMGTSFAIILEAESRAEAVKEYERIKSLNTPSAKTKGQTATQKPKTKRNNYERNRTTSHNCRAVRI
jgi:hypothetical protein